MSSVFCSGWTHYRCIAVHCHWLLADAYWGLLLHTQRSAQASSVLDSSSPSSPGRVSGSHPSGPGLQPQSLHALHALHPVIPYTCPPHLGHLGHLPSHKLHKRRSLHSITLLVTVRAHLHCKRCAGAERHRQLLDHVLFCGLVVPYCCAGTGAPAHRHALSTVAEAEANVTIHHSAHPRACRARV